MKWTLKLIRRMAPTTLENKILIYKTIIRPIWTYGIELWGCSCKSNVNIIQKFQSKFLRTITNSPWYISNKSLHNDLQIEYVSEIINKKSIKTLSKTGTSPKSIGQFSIPVSRSKKTKKKMATRSSRYLNFY